MSDVEFKNLERDNKGNIKDLYYWYTFVSEKQRNLLTNNDKRMLKQIQESPGYMGRELAFNF